MDADLSEAMKCKESGNLHFKNQDFLEAIKCYTEALHLSPEGNKCKAVFLKNRAACYLKLQQYSLALKDCSESLRIDSNDIKTLYRRAVANEASGNLTDAFADLKYLLTIEPRNREGIELAQKLTTQMKKQHDTLQSTDGIIKEMFRSLQDKGLPQAKITMAAKNCAILSRENAGAEKLYEAGAIEILLPLLESKSDEVVHHVLQTFAGMCMGHKERANAILQGITLEKISSLINSESSQVSSSALTMVKQALVSTSASSEDGAISEADTTLAVRMIRTILKLLLDSAISSSSRDQIMEVFVSTISKNSLLVSIYLQEGLVSMLLELSTVADRAGSEFAVSQECRANISVVLSSLLSSSPSEDGLAMEKECELFVQQRLSTNELSLKREGVLAVATLLHGVLDIGAKIFMKESVFSEVLKMGTSGSIESQSVAAEVLALASSNKERCQGILKDGLPVMKELFSSPDDSVKVRALVGLCKLGGLGGSNINARTFAEGSGLKLEKACRRFLLSGSTSGRLYRWAVEGLAFLSLDAEVKEALISNKKALKVLCTVPKTGDQSLYYGLATILVNLTNSYEKPERNPELEELGKYAGENVPKEHELDGESYVKKRVSCLLDEGVVSALLSLSNVDSHAIHEQVTRVFLALVEQVSHRGMVLQQGGVKTLLALTTNNTDKAKPLAAQALAKIGITSDPKLSFPGQRAFEVVRPLVKLLKSDHGLQQFEALMALTNLAGISADVRQRIFKEGGVVQMESLMFEEHDLIRRAATEALCNMIQMPEVHERFLSDDVERVKLWTLFSGEEDFELARAASGGLAQLTHDSRICAKVMEVKSATAILKELLAHEKEELQHRAAYVVANLVEASREIAETIISGDFLEILMALSLTTTTSPSVKASANRALKKAVDYGLIEPNPQLN